MHVEDEYGEDAEMKDNNVYCNWCGELIGNVEPDLDTSLSFDFNGTTVHFCAEDCKKAFEDDLR